MYTSYDPLAKKKAKMRSEDRIFILAPEEGKKPLSSLMAPDPRLFSGENKLHGVFNEQIGLWEVHFEMGGIPPALKQGWTTFSELERAVRDYYKKRNVKIVQVID